MVDIFEAKTHFSELAEKVNKGEKNEIIIAKNGKPYVKLVGVNSVVSKKRNLGIADGQMNIPDNFDELECDFSWEDI